MTRGDSAASVEPSEATAGHLTTRHLAVLIGLSMVLLLLSFPPFGQLDGFPIWLALVPMLTAARLADSRRLALVSWILGFVYAVVALSWLRYIGPFAGIAAILALGLYMSFYPPVFLVSWKLVDRRLRLPAIISVPLVWVSLEYLRSFLLTGFPWFYLGHSVYRNLTLIQIADVFGAYGVSVLVAAVNGLGADLLWPALDPDRPTAAYAHARVRLLASAAVVVGALAATIAYGTVRLREVTVTDGPRVGLVQGNIPQSLKFEPMEDRRIFDIHAELSRQAAARDPDLIIWPETMAPGYYLDGRFESSDKSFDIDEDMRALPGELGCPMLLGVRLVTGATEANDFQLFNSALLLDRRGQVEASYSKVHLVPFGEFIPSFLRPLARLLPKAINPVPYRYGVESGKVQTVFTLPWDDGKRFRFGVLICYEDTMPYLARGLAREGVDSLINITNDGWFDSSSELDQHVIASVFRAVETRLPVVRSANTGISSIISPRGEEVARLVDPATGKDRGVAGVLVHPVPLASRHWDTLATQWGDLPAQLFSVAGLLVVAASLERQRRLRKTAKRGFFG